MRRLKRDADTGTHRSGRLGIVRPGQAVDVSDTLADELLEDDAWLCVDDADTCLVELTYGDRAGEPCGRDRPCRFHD